MTSQPLRILLLDDNPDDRVMAIRALRREFSDLRVEQIADAENLGRSLEAGDFDLVITECQLHWTDGLAVLSAVKATWPDRPVIMFTGTGSEEIAVEAVKAGLDDYLPKSPEHFNRLPAAVRSALAQAQKRPAPGDVETRYRTERKRLLQAGQQQSRRLALLADVARTVADTLDADSLLQAVADAIHRHFAYPSVGLFTLDGKEQTLILRGYSGAPANPPELTAVGQPIERGITGYVARTGKPRLARDVTIDPYHQPSGQVAMRSEVCVPILEAGRPVGVIDVQSDRLADFDEEDRSLLQAAADTVGIGLRNARLHDESRRRSQELTLLNRISVRFGAVLNLDTLINDALEGLHELVNADRTYFITVDPDARTWETTHERVAPGIEMDVGLTGTFDDAPVELETLLEGQPFAVFDTATDPRVEATRGMYRLLGAQSALLVPVRYGKRLYGALGFDNCREKRVWNPDEVRLLEGVAHQLELALENLHLFEEVRLRADESAATLARLEELDRLKDRFIQNVSHELRSPLAIIRGYVEMLEAGELGELRPKQQKPVAIIGRRVRMLSDLVQDIMLILEAEVSPPEPEAVALDELVRMTAEDFQLAVEQAELTLHTEITPHLPPVSASYGYLRRVLDNLLGNAVKFTPAGGAITVRVRQEGEQVALEVSDTGVGIPPDQLEYIFERFYQVDGSIWRQHGGVGLGLALVKELVETYGGSVTAESQVGEGSTFTVLLPIATDTDGRGEKPQDTHGEQARTS